GPNGQGPRLRRGVDRRGSGLGSGRQHRRGIVHSWPPVPRVHLAAIALGVVAIKVVLAASALGWFGGVSVCGADRTPGSDHWPIPISEAVWAAFILGVAILLVWQTRT